MDERREFLRHTLATLAYRAARAVTGAPDEFAGFDGAGRTPGEILAHMGDLFDWALSISRGEETWHSSEPLPWAEEKLRFFAALEAFDALLASEELIQAPLERLFQGPVADALTHTGQIAMLRRLAEYTKKDEDFFRAAIAAGRVGVDQAAPIFEY
ncbi:hypothetical protein [Terracidiphilus gabretensis]|uniref:hypothetical protein n=1 Tax=Terracidiphilus gabretensis TaxID=1577687 RepID=UPI00071BC3F8|nr:hypothetical protein [Terracidiphilus gabretensis]